MIKHRMALVTDEGDRLERHRILRSLLKQGYSGGDVSETVSSEHPDEL
jgi:hypothetical protein